MAFLLVTSASTGTAPRYVFKQGSDEEFNPFIRRSLRIGSLIPSPHAAFQGLFLCVHDAPQSNIAEIEGDFKGRQVLSVCSFYFNAL